MTDKCAGENCTSIDGFNHSVECLFEHFAAYTGAYREPIDVLRKIKKAYFDGYEAAATALCAENAELVAALKRIDGMVYDSWTNGATAGEIAYAALAKNRGE